MRAPRRHLRELASESGLSQHALARALGRDVSWVSRRLALLTALSEPLLAAVCAGQLSTWAAVRASTVIIFSLMSNR